MTARICLDPGHGGWDSGATAVDGRLEKEFTLALGLAVRSALTARYQCEVVLTRATDVALAPSGSLGEELRARAEVGNQAQADLFLSLHHDAASSPEARGGSLWIWRDHPEAGVGHSPAIDPVTGQAQHSAPRSHEAGVKFLDPVRDLLATYGIPWRSYGSPSGISTADFGVLRHFDGPGLLLECFFGSAPADVAEARRPSFIPDLAGAVAEGLARALALPAAPAPATPAVAPAAQPHPETAPAPEPAPAQAPAPAPAEPGVEAYPAVLILNDTRLEDYTVVDGRVSGPLRPLLDELRYLGYQFQYDWRTRTLSVFSPVYLAARRRANR